MDSGLLNVFHDDPFDGNYMKYQNDTNYWSNDNETMDLQLTETLQGILPITNANNDDDEDEQNVSNISNAIAASSNNITENYAATKYLKNNFQIDKKLERSNSKIVEGKEMFYYHEFPSAAGDTIEIVTVDPDADDYDSDIDDDDQLEEGDDDNDLVEIEGEEEEVNVNFDDYDDGQSEYSDYTFRTRTDSSSIGDYESHTSDYDDDDDAAFENAGFALAPAANKIEGDDALEVVSIFEQDELNALPDLSKKSSDSVVNKNRTISVNTNASDVDALGMQIDANTFDLADFITKDDFMLNISSVAKLSKQTAVPLNTLPSTTLLQIRNVDSDNDSDVIVDVETVEVEEKTAPLIINNINLHEEDIAFVDNVKSDPLWSPKQQKKLEKDALKAKPKATTIAVATTTPTTTTTITSTPATSNFSIVPNKKQCVLLKSLCGGGGSGSIDRNNRGGKLAAKKLTATSSVGKRCPINSGAINIPKVGIGQGGKNLALIEHNRNLSISEKSSDENNTPVKTSNEAAAKSTEITSSTSTAAVQTTTTVTTTVKRKLNLEEYKKRRGENTIPNSATNSAHIAKVKKLDKDAIINNVACQRNALQVKVNPNTSTTTTITTTPIKHSEEVSAVVRSLKAEMTQQKPATDPITEAKNKVLRMQELKKAQQLKIIDSTVSAKVGRVTKLLPLKEIVKDTYCAVDEQQENAKSVALKTHPDYEEIIIVSTSCNTDVSIPPITALPNKSAMDMKNVNEASRSLLKSSVLLYNMTNTFEKAQAAESAKISANSLICSIQDVVVKQTTPAVVNESGQKSQQQQQADIVKKNIAMSKSEADGANAVEEHGENKIIMHLRKDRIRKRTTTIATQTDYQPTFPLLPLEKNCAIDTHKSRERVKKCRERKYRRAAAAASRSASSSSSSSSDSETASDDSHSSVALSYRSRSRSVAIDSCSSSSHEGVVYHKSDSTNGGGAAAGGSTTAGGYSSRSSRRHRSSISSSYSETERRMASVSSNALNRRQRRTSYKQRSKKHNSRCSRSRSSSSLSSSESDYSERSRSRTRSRSPYYRSRRSPSISSCRSRTRGYNNNNNNNNRVSQPAVEERRIVYVGRIEQETTKDMLRRKFLSYGTIKQITIHYKENGMKYGFITYERAQDAFAVIDTGAKDSQINMYDLSFGGRRAFCRASYADLDNAGINTYQSFVFPQVVAPPREEDSFEALLLKVKAKMNANKSTTPAAAPAAAAAARPTTNNNNDNSNKI